MYRRRRLGRPTLEINDRNHLETVIAATPGTIGVRVLSCATEDIAQNIYFLGAIKPMSTIIGVNLGEAPVFVSITQVRRADPEYACNLGRTEAPKRFALFGLKGNFHLPIKRLG